MKKKKIKSLDEAVNRQLIAHRKDISVTLARTFSGLLILHMKKTHFRMCIAKCHHKIDKIHSWQQPSGLCSTMMSGKMRDDLLIT